MSIWNNVFFSCAVFFLLTSLVACGSMTEPGINAEVSAESAPLRELRREYYRNMAMSGRLSARYEVNNKPESAHVGFNWVQTAEQTVVTLRSPTGQTLATLVSNDHGAQLTLPDRPPQFARDANQLLLNTLGWPLPVAGLKDWLQGFTDADHQSLVTSASSANTFFVDGWNLRYVTWTTWKAGVENSDRPKRLDLFRQTDQAGLVSLRIVIDEWNGQ